MKELRGSACRGGFAAGSLVLRLCPFSPHSGV